MLSCAQSSNTSLVIRVITACDVVTVCITAKSSNASGRDRVPASNIKGDVLRINQSGTPDLCTPGFERNARVSTLRP